MAYLDGTEPNCYEKTRMDLIVPILSPEQKALARRCIVFDQRETCPRSEYVGVDAFVYVIGPIEQHGPCKIGFSDLPEARLIELQTGNWMKLEIKAMAGASYRNARRLEIAAHRFAAKYGTRLSGEWFEVDYDVAIGAVVEAASDLGIKIYSKECLSEISEQQRALSEEARRVEMRRKLGID